MDKKKSLINVIFAITFKFIILILGILSRRFMIQYVGNDANGLASLYSSIIGILSLAELGIGTAITYSMYKPIVEGDNKKVSALYCAFKKIYKIIALIILIIGICVMPLLPALTKDYSLSSNIYLNYMLMLISVVISYAYSANTSLINAYKNSYITTTIYSLGLIVELILQMIVVYVFRSLELYFAAKIINTLLQWGITHIYSKKHFSKIIVEKESLTSEDKKEIYKNSKALLMHKIGGVLVNAVDSVIISAFIGVSILGKYTNYTTIVIALTGIIGLFFTPLTAIIGHVFAEGDNKKLNKYFNFFFNLNFLIGVIFYLGYYSIIDNLIPLCFGDELDLVMDKSIPLIITLNYFIQFMKQSTMLFRDASGIFYYDRWKPLIEGLTNLVLSIVFVLIFPQGYEILGVIVATIITNLFICHTVEPFVLFKYGLHKPIGKHYLKRFLLISSFVLLVFLMDVSMVSLDNNFYELLINGSISILISLIPVILMFVYGKEFRHMTFNIFKYLKRNIENLKQKKKLS